MPRKLSIKTKTVTFFCSTCSNKYLLESGHHEDVINIDICCNCHPFYLGKSGLDITLGAAEKLKDKFAKGRAASIKATK